MGNRPISIVTYGAVFVWLHHLIPDWLSSRFTTTLLLARIPPFSGRELLAQSNKTTVEHLDMTLKQKGLQGLISLRQGGWRLMIQQKGATKLGTVFIRMLKLRRLVADLMADPASRHCGNLFSY